MRKGWRQKQHEIKRRHERQAAALCGDDRDPRLAFIDKLPSTEEDGCFCCGAHANLLKHYVREEDIALLARTAVFLCEDCAGNVWDLRPVRADRLLFRRRIDTSASNRADASQPVVRAVTTSQPGQQLTFFD